MSTTQEKLSQVTQPKMKIMDTDHENIKLSRDAFEAKYRRKAEIEKKVELERIRLEEIAANEEKELEKIGAQDNEPGNTATEE